MQSNSQSRQLRLLAIGDIVGPETIAVLKGRLSEIKKENNVSFVIANGENASAGNGLSPDDASAILDCGVDIITNGNHVWQKNSLRHLLDDCPFILRPANYPPGLPGVGFKKLDIEGSRILVINVQGTVFMDSLECPFACVEKILAKEADDCDFTVIDIHAEATSEKLALARCFDGKVSVVFGTHTHIVTADERILPGGTAYITDLGMTGPADSVLGVRSDCIIERLRNKIPVHFELAHGNIELNGIIVTLDTVLKKAVGIERIFVKMT